MIELHVGMRVRHTAWRDSVELVNLVTRLVSGALLVVITTPIAALFFVVRVSWHVSTIWIEVTGCDRPR